MPMPMPMPLTPRRLGLLVACAALLVGCDLANLLTQPDPKEPGLAIRKFASSAEQVSAGTAVTLNWEVVGATTVELDQAIGEVPPKGSRIVRPAATTVYTLQARAPNAAAAASVRVTVR